MSQAGYTPIQLYYSTTTSNTPSAGNLADGELAINTADGKLFYKDNLGVVQTIANKNNTGTVTSVSGTGTVNGLTLTGTVTSSGSLTLGGTLSGVDLTSQVTGTLPVGNGGTGITALGTGVQTALGNNANAAAGFITGAGTATLTNKRIDPRVSSAASAASVTPDISAYDQYAFTALAAGLTINAPTGTPADGDKLIFRILDNGTARALTWNATYTVIGVTLPTTTVINKTTYVGCIYNANNTRWDVVAVTTQA